MNFPSHFFFTHEDSRFRVRPIRPSDKDLLQRGFSELSERSKYLRLFQINNRLTNTQLKYFTEVDGIQHVAWGILDESGEESMPVGIGRFVKYKDEQDVAEVAITVIDSHQGRGLGILLFVTLNFIAAQRGLKKLRYYVLRENRFAMNSLKKFTILNQKNEGTVTILDISVIPNHKAIKDDVKMQRFIAAMKIVEEEMGM
ncbi:MAG: GNAT superfamily N-acetyltransferase [Vicingaceae bacterium]|jgi:GNAT superfamily N-acetyltransferase